MYSQRVVGKTLDKLCATFKVSGVRRHSVAEVEEWIARLLDAEPPAKSTVPSRRLTPEEEAFILNELILFKADFEYAASRYFYCSVEGAGIKRMYPLFDSQKLTLAEVARIEEEIEDSQLAEGILINTLKARRLGMSTLAQAMLWHRVVSQTFLQGVVASDVPSQSSYTISIGKMMYDGLPWWLKPGLRAFSNTYPEEYEFVTGSHIWCHAGQSVRGMVGERGQIGRGKGPSIIHLTELATWDDTSQIDSALLPTIPYSPRALAVFESSPRGRNNWWHTHWTTCMKGSGRFRPVFIPWYAEPRKYSRPAPPGWSPADTTLAHARRCEEQGPRWLHASRVSLTREQLFWYESTRAYYEEKDKLSDFLQEYAADPEECFVFSGRTLIPLAVLQGIQDRARAPLAAFEIAPQMDVEKARLMEERLGPEAGR